MDKFAVGLRDRNKRRWMKAGLAGVALAMVGSPARATPSYRRLRVGLTPAFLHDQHVLLADWRAYMERHLGRQVDFIQRDSYRETMDLIRLDKLDFAWICDYPFIHLRDKVRLMAVPLYQGRPYYRSYLLVRAGNAQVKSMADLKDAVFAYADPYSNTGYLSPRYAVRKLGADPNEFFRKTFFTYSHRKVVEAVARGLAHAGAVDSFVWDTLAKQEPALASRTRIVWRSPEYGFPPFVAQQSGNEADFRAMQDLLLEMPGDVEGRNLLGRLNLDGFIKGGPELYQSVTDMMKVFGET
jgi:phosphonate transport system substrate-binding protein